MNSNRKLQGLEAFKSDAISTSEAKSIRGADGLTSSCSNTYIGKNGDSIIQNDIGYSNGTTKKVGPITNQWRWC